MNWDLLNKQLAAYQMGVIKIETVLGLLFIAAIVIGVFYILKRYIVPFLGSRAARKRSRVILYRAEVLTWVVYLVFGLYQLFSDSFYITGAILIIVMLAGYNFWRDLFGGIAFRLENKYQINDPVRFEDYTGTLAAINRRNIRIKTEKEELVTIPFRKLNNTVFIKRQAKGKLHSAQLTVQIGAKPIEEVIPQIDNWLYECPWSIVNDKAKIKVIGGGLVQITVYAVDRPSIQKTEDFIQKKLRK